VYCGKTVDPGAVWGGEWGGRGIGVLDGGGDRRRGRAELGVNLGRPIVTNGDCCVVVRERRTLPKFLLGGLVLSCQCPVGHVSCHFYGRHSDGP